MKLVKLECPNCGAKIDINKEKNCVCKYCGTTILVDDEAKNIIINSDLDIPKKTLLKNAKNFYEMNEMLDGNNCINKILSEDPFNSEALCLYLNNNLFNDGIVDDDLILKLNRLEQSDKELGKYTVEIEKFYKIVEENQIKKEKEKEQKALEYQLEKIKRDKENLERKNKEEKRQFIFICFVLTLPYIYFIILYKWFFAISKGLIILGLGGLCTDIFLIIFKLEKLKNMNKSKKLLLSLVLSAILCLISLVILKNMDTENMLFGQNISSYSSVENYDLDNRQFNERQTTTTTTKKQYTVNTEQLFILIDLYTEMSISNYPNLTFSSNSNASSTMYEITIKSEETFSKEEFEEIKKDITRSMFNSLKLNSYTGSLKSKNSTVCINFNLYIKEEKKYSKDWISISLLYLTEEDADLLKDFDEFYEKEG